MKRGIAVALLVALAGCALGSVQLDPQKEVATTIAPFDAKLGFNRVTVPVGSRLAAATIDGEPAFCTTQPAFFAMGEARGVCFTDAGKTGYLDRYYVLGTIKNLRYDAHIPYTLNSETAFGNARTQRVDITKPMTKKEKAKFDADTAAFDKKWREENARSTTRDQLAIEQCNYQAQTVEMMTPGIIMPWANGIATRRRCLEFYQRTGTIPGQMK